eukprot:scaffold105847_cov35-Tisochrysis_lutea.AAC.3
MLGRRQSTSERKKTAKVAKAKNKKHKERANSSRGCSKVESKSVWVGKQSPTYLSTSVASRSSNASFAHKSLEDFGY